MVVLCSEHNLTLTITCRLANHYHVPLVILYIFFDDSHLPPPGSPSSTSTSPPKKAVAFTARRLNFCIQTLRHAASNWSDFYGAGVAVQVNGGEGGKRNPNHLTLVRRSTAVMTDEPFVNPFFVFMEPIK